MWFPCYLMASRWMWKIYVCLEKTVCLIAALEEWQWATWENLWYKLKHYRKMKYFKFNFLILETIVSFFRYFKTVDCSRLSLGCTIYYTGLWSDIHRHGALKAWYRENSALSHHLRTHLFQQCLWVLNKQQWQCMRSPEQTLGVLYKAA